jgi:NADH-quinone oxidoreductase subunit M
MVQKVFYGEVNSVTATVKEISWNEKLILGIIVLSIFFIGVYPQPVFNLTRAAVKLVTG